MGSSRATEWGTALNDRFEWDEAKQLANIEKHNIDFLRMRRVFDGRPNVTIEGNNEDESRFLTTAVLDEKHYTVIWTQRGERIRIISARRARDGERRAYRQLYGEGN